MKVLASIQGKFTGDGGDSPAYPTQDNSIPLEG